MLRQSSTKLVKLYGYILYNRIGEIHGYNIPGVSNNYNKTKLKVIITDLPNNIKTI